MAATPRSGVSRRARILGQIRRSLGREALPAKAQALLEAGLQDRRPNIIPARAQISPDRQVDLFQRMAEKVSATMVRVAGLGDVPGAVGDYLARQNLPTDIRMSPDGALAAIPWDHRPLLTIKQGRAEPDDMVSVTPAFAGIAETGTLMLASGASRPATLNFMPDTHIVILKASQVVGDYETAFERLRAAHRGIDGQFMPRTVNLVTGPSRTGDIEQTLILGAHGPRRLHIVLVEDGTV